MVVDEIVTSLKNAVDHGDSLENAMQLAIGSGYNPADVQEAAKFVSGGTINFQPKPREQLAMPAQKTITGKPVIKPLIPQQQSIQNPNPQKQPVQIKNDQVPIQFQVQPQPINNQISGIRQDNQAIKDNISYGSVFTNSNSPSLYRELNDIKPPKESYLKEILLVFILLILIGVLAASFIFKDKILQLFSSMAA